MTMMRNKLIAHREQILEAYRNGATLREIGELYESSSGTIRQILVDMGEKLRPRGRRRKEDVHDPRILFPEEVEGVEFEEFDVVENLDNTYEGGTF